MQAAPDVSRDTHKADAQNAQNAQGTTACPQSNIRARHAEYAVDFLCFSLARV